MVQNNSKKESLYRAMRLVAPGTILYEGLENILRAKTGALIVVSDSEGVMKLVDGGFRINCEMQPASLYELAKMDGAIILSAEGKKILSANVLLTPDHLIPTSETGARHRTAERIAIQTGELVISISQRRSIITLYKGHERHVLRDIGTVLSKANQALQTLQKYKSVLDQALLNLSSLEFEDLVTLNDVSLVVHRIEKSSRIAAEIARFVYELGAEGRLVNMQLQELMFGVKEEGAEVIRDYVKLEQPYQELIQEELAKCGDEDLLDFNLICRILGYPVGVSLDETVKPRGYRILQKIPRLPMMVVDNLVKQFGDLQKVLEASIDELDDVEGIGEARARIIKEGLRRFREKILLDRHF